MFEMMNKGQRGPFKKWNSSSPLLLRRFKGLVLVIRDEGGCLKLGVQIKYEILNRGGIKSLIY